MKHYNDSLSAVDRTRNLSIPRSVHGTTEQFNNVFQDNKPSAYIQKNVLFALFSLYFAIFNHVDVEQTLPGTRK